MPAIGITGSYGGRNLGDEAILCSMVASLRERVPGAELTVFSRNAEHTAQHHDIDHVVGVRDMTRSEVRGHVERLDLLLLGGGGILYDSEAIAYLREVDVAQRSGIPTVAFAVGAGPLDHRNDRDAVRTSMTGMREITVRDSGAKRILEHVGVDREIQVTADPALLLAAEPFPVAALEAEGVCGGRPLVGMSIREPGKAAPELDVAGYHAMLAYTADFVVHRFGGDILFIPMERQDIRRSHAVIAEMVSAEHAHVLAREYPPGQMLGLMEHLDMVIAMRLHLLIFSALTGTPFLPLPYAAKITDFVKAVGVPPPVPVRGDSAGPLLAAVDHLWDTRHQAGRRLAAPVAALQDRARRTLDIALACLPGTTLGAATIA